MNQNIKCCAKLLKESGYDSILISNPVNITYLTGLKQDGGYLLLSSDQYLVYFTNFLYWETAKMLKNCKTILSDKTKPIFSLVAREIEKLGHKKIGFESKHIPVLEYQTINRLLLSKKIEFSATNDLIEKARLIKNDQELSFIKKSISISREAFNFVKEIFDEEMTEKDMVIEIDKFLRLRGDNEIAFNTIVASGKNTAFPHHFSGDDKLSKKFFLTDLGSRYYGYCADLTRVFFWGKMPHLFRKIYDTVRKAQELSFKKIKDGVTASQVDKAARDFIEKKGWGKYFGHGVGHGIGLSVHELPFLSPNNNAILKEGMVVTIEPAIYLAAKFGVRIEDMVLVREKNGELLSGDINWKP